MEFDFNTLLGVSFTAWAGIVAWVGNGIRSDLRQLSERLQAHIVQTEGRLATLESKADK
jgi:hypothetical protein